MQQPAESAALSCPMPCKIRTPYKGFAWLRSAAFWVVGGRLAGIGVTMVLNVILARQLLPAEFGKFNLLSSLIALLSLFSMFGLSGAVVRFIPESLAFGESLQAKRILRLSYVTMGLAWALVAIAVWGCWSWLAAEYDLPHETSFMALVAASAGLIALLQLTAESMRGFHELRFASLLSGGQTGGLLSNTLFVCLLMGWGGLVSTTLVDALALNVMALLVIVPLALTLLLKTARDYRTDTHGSVSHIVQPELPLPAAMLLVCVPILLVQIIALFSSQADIFIAAGTCSETDMGLYSAARRLMVLVAMPLQMANFLVISSIAELKAKNKLKELQGLLQSVAILAAIPAMVALVSLILGGGPLLELLFGTAYRDAAVPLAILACGQLVLVWAGSSHTTLLMTGHQNKALTVNAVSALLLLASGTWAANHYGIFGLSIVSATIVILENLVLMLLVRKLLGIKAHVPLNVAKWAERLAKLDQIGRLTSQNNDDKSQAEGVTHAE
jgi:O-antigen/teichoic acid export membrane protein